MDFVDLDRRFAEHSEEESAEDGATLWSGFDDLRGAIGWDVVLQNRFLVVLGEPGTGKTTEFREKSAQLETSHLASFFIAIEDLANNQLEHGVEQRIDEWLKESRDGVFFLDSVDEARLSGPNAFRYALSNLTRKLKESTARASLIISCRVSDWLVYIDKTNLQVSLRAFIHAPSSAPTTVSNIAYTNSDMPGGTSTITSPLKNEFSDVEIKIYRLGRLDKNRINKLATAWNTPNVDLFMQSMYDAELEKFAGRPRDLEWLIGYWKENQHFGNLMEMIEKNIDHKLEEANYAHRLVSAPLSPQDARFGATQLAAATVFCERPFLLLPDQQFAGDPPASAIQPGEVLNSWDARRISSLLNRGLYDPATYGRVKIHDDNVRDYLVARWLVYCLRHGQQPYRKIRDFVFGEVFGELRPIPNRRAILGWLATLNEEIRRDAIKVAPDTVLYFGDVSQIPIEDKASALRSLAAKLEVTGWSGWRVFDSDVRRIADPNLEPVVRDLLTSSNDSYEIKSLMLRLARLAPMPGVADVASHLATNLDNLSLQFLAAQTVAEIGSDDQKLTLVEFAQTGADLSNHVLGNLCSALFPEVIGVEDCMRIAARAAAEGPDRGIGIGQIFSFNIVSSCPKEQLVDLLDRLVSLANTQPMIDGYQGPIISEHYAWVFESLLRLFVRVLRELNTEEMSVDVIGCTYTLLEKAKNHRDFSYYDYKEVKNELSVDLVLRRVCYWAKVKDALSRDPAEGRQAWGWYENLIDLKIGDLSWLLDDLSKVRAPEELEAICEASVKIWINSGRPDDVAAQIHAAIHSVSGLSDIQKQSVANRLVETPVTTTDWEIEQKKDREAREQAHQEMLTQIKSNLLGRLDGLRTGEDFEALYQCHKIMRNQENVSNNSFAQVNWPDLEEAVGREITDAAQEGYLRFWKTFSPVLPLDRENNHGIENGLFVGLSGLALASTKRGAFEHITEQEAEIAVHYAFRELNGFPSWLEHITDRFPNVVIRVLKNAVAAEFSISADSDVRPDILSRLHFGPNFLRQLSSDTIIDLLESDPPSNLLVLSSVLDVVIKSGQENSERFTRIASIQVDRALELKKEDTLIVWLHAFLCINAIGAIDYLDKLGQFRTNFPSRVLQGIAAGLEHRGSIGESDYLQQPEVLRRLIPMMYQYIRIEDDPIHDGAYTVGPRENAQHLRDSLPQWLANINGVEAHGVLLSLSEAFRDAYLKTLFSRLAEEQAARAIERSPMGPSEIASFADGFEIEPKTGTMLFDLSIDRLIDIKDDIERGDFSDRNLFEPGMPEKNIQKWLANRLRRESRDKYNVLREEEVDQEQKTDIRLHHPGAGYVTIEVKPVDSQGGRYTFTELVSAIKEQLVGQYLRSANSRYGILVVTMLEKRYWVPRDGGGRIEFAELLDRLNLIAEEIVRETDDVDELSVIGIDFSDPI